MTKYLQCTLKLHVKLCFHHSLILELRVFSIWYAWCTRAQLHQQNVQSLKVSGCTCYFCRDEKHLNIEIWPHIHKAARMQTLIRQQIAMSREDDDNKLLTESYHWKHARAHSDLCCFVVERTLYWGEVTLAMLWHHFGISCSSQSLRCSVRADCTRFTQSVRLEWLLYELYSYHFMLSPPSCSPCFCFEYLTFVQVFRIMVHETVRQCEQKFPSFLKSKSLSKLKLLTLLWWNHWHNLS